MFKHKNIAIIQARMGSTRLPGKVLKDISGKSQLEWVIDRVSQSKRIDKVIVATTTNSEDDPIRALGREMCFEVYSGSSKDVLDRYYQVALLERSEYITRVTADCPCFDPELLDEAILQLDPKSDYLGMISKTFPDGLDIEIIRFNALERSWHEAHLQSEREHVTQYIIKHPDSFVLQDFVSNIGDHGKERWTVDEPEDFELVSLIFEHFLNMGIQNFGYHDILDFLDKNPDLRSINSRYERDEGLLESLKKDKVV